MEHLIYLLPLYAALGCFVGFAAGLLGVGGGVLLVPGLYAIEQHFGTGDFSASGLMPMALATSMGIIIPTGVSSSRAQIKRGAVNWDAVKKMAPGLVVGVVLGITVISKLENETLRYIFACGLLVISALIYFRKETVSEELPVLNPAVTLPVGVSIGLVATMLGVGGAILNIPYLNRAGIPLRNAIASSSVLGVVVSLPAAIGFLITGFIHGNTFLHFNILAFVVIAPLSILFAPIGVKVSHALPPKTLKLIFAGLLALLSIKMFLSA